MDATNIAWLTFITASALWWAVTNGLISYYEQRQDEMSRLYFRSYLATMNSDHQTELGNDEFLIKLELAHLRLVTVPDVVSGLRVFRAQTIGMLCSSVALLFLILVFKIMTELGILQEPDMKK